MAGPGDEVAARAGGRGHLRASHADREQVVGTLKAAFVQGMLAKDEFDVRVGWALAARTYADLAALTADLPAGLAVAPPGLTRSRGGQPTLRPGPVATAATALYAGLWAYGLLGGDFPGAGAVIILGGLVWLCVVAIAAAVAAENRQGKRACGQLPRGRRPGAGGPASRRLPPAGPGGQLPQAGPGHSHSHAIEAAQRRRPRPSLPVRGLWADRALAAGSSSRSLR
jgi:hypothetical protein